MSNKTSTDDRGLMDLYHSYQEGRVSRRDFMRGAAVMGVGAVAAPAMLSTLPGPSAGAARQPASAQAGPAALDLAEWSYFWVGVERLHHPANGTMVSGRQMYVEYFTPAQVRHPYTFVLVHGGGGQGTDWMGAPDGHPGWVTYLLQEGYKVAVVDRPGHGRPPIHPILHGGFPAQAATLEQFSGQFTPPNAARPATNDLRKLHNQWPGTGEIGSKDLDQFVASQGGSWVQVPSGGGGRGAAAGAPVAPPPLDGGVGTGNETYHMIWRQNGAEMLDKLGPSIIVTHSAGGPFGWIVAEARPNLVKGIIAVEGAGAPFQGQNLWGLSDVPVAYDPPVSDPAQIKTKRVTPADSTVNPYLLQQEPARKLKNLLNTPVALVTSEASFASPGSPAAAEYLRQAGVKAEDIRLVKANVHGNGHMMMVEKNNRQVLQVLLDWANHNVTQTGAASRAPRATAGTAGTGAGAAGNTTAMKVSDWGYFWVGTNHKPMPYGTILSGQMFVQYFKPAQQRGLPVILVHGGTGQMLHYMGAGDGMAGWAHHYVQAGYPVYLVDRPGHGRAPFHPDALGPIGNQPTYAGIVADTRRSAAMPNKQWPGTTGEVGDPLVDQFMASQNGSMADLVLQQTMWALGGAELLDRIGPAIVQVHSAGGPFSWLVGNERPNLVKAIVNVEGGGGANAPWGLTNTPLAYDPPVFNPDDLKFRQVTPPEGSNQPAYRLQDNPVRKLKNLSQMPILYVVAERSGRNGQPIIEFLKQAGCQAELLNLKDKNILGNGHFMMIEKNNKQVFDAIRGWIEQKLPPVKA